MVGKIEMKGYSSRLLFIYFEQLQLINDSFFVDSIEFISN